MTEAGSSGGPQSDGGPVFDDGKADGAMRTIGEVSAAFDIKPHVLRYWETKFPTLTPLKRSGGRRLYRAEDVAMVEQIDRLVNREGYTLKGAKRALASGTAEQKPDVGEAVATAMSASPPSNAPDPVAIARQLRAIRDRLSAALNA